MAEFESPPEPYRQSADLLERPRSGEAIEWSVGEQRCDGQRRYDHSAGQAKGSIRETVSGTVTESVDSLKGSATNVYNEVRSTAQTGYSRLSQTARDLARVSRRTVKTARQEYPLQTLMALAGLGLVIGIALRLWRNHEPPNA